MESSWLLAESIFSRKLFPQISLFKFALYEILNRCWSPRWCNLFVPLHLGAMQIHVGFCRTWASKLRAMIFFVTSLATASLVGELLASYRCVLMGAFKVRLLVAEASSLESSHAADHKSSIVVTEPAKIG